ncbi:hypothetical protein [Nocardioides sp. W7]|uniref:hypothetical protein n=1 Tax=Nocardioides sp. W7 TaxID=2931390 RepID=UPI001FD00EDD|nr:hypothetical protein [Nocardioides sp. W7]
MTTPRTARLGIAVALLLCVSACGTETSGPVEATKSVPEEAEESGGPSDERPISCTGEAPGWPASAMDGGIASRLPADELTRALEALAARAGIDAPSALQDADVHEAPWFVLAETKTSVVVATGSWDGGGPGRDGEVVRLKASGAGWQVQSWGDCRNLAPVVDPGLQWVRIDAATDLDPASTEVTVEVTEGGCTSGRDPRPFLQEPTLVEDDDSVVVFWTSEAPEGANNCVGNQPVPHPLRLGEPLGDRELLDGSRWPARPVPRRR